MSASFYRAVVQLILLYGLETWVLLASMAKMIEETHTEVLRLITGRRARQLGDRTRETPGEEGVREEEGIHLSRISIEHHQATVAQWVALRPLFEVCAMETGYEGWGRRRKAW